MTQSTERGKIAFVFPGQASQYVGMGRDLYEHSELAGALFDEIDNALGFSLLQLCFNGPEDELKRTAITQPAILAVSVVAYSCLRERGVRPDYVAGHSLGEYSALVAAESLQFKEAIDIVHCRGRYMQEAVPAGEGAMAAIMGMPIDKIEAITLECARDGVVRIANLNSPAQIVISGEKKTVENTVEKLKKEGARRAVMLPVSAPFHCPLMKPAEEKLAARLADVNFNSLRYPLITNADVAVITDGDQALPSLVKQVRSPVRWWETIDKLIELGVERFVEVGPGKVLGGLIRKINRKARVLNVEDIESLDSVTKELNKQA